MERTRKPGLETAAQYLTWALEEIEKIGHANAALHARIALEELFNAARSVDKAKGRETSYGDEAKRYRDKADEVQQLAELAATPSRRDALTRIAENYNSAAARMALLSEPQRNAGKNKR